MNSRWLSLLTTAWCITIRAQGTIDFSNFSIGGQGVNAPFYHSDGVTKLSGFQFMAEMLAGANANSLPSIATTSFLTGTAAGYFNGGTQIVPDVPMLGTAWVVVRVWNEVSGTSFLQAQNSGLPDSWWQSSPFTVRTGGVIINPVPPGVLTGLGFSPIPLNSVPEPSTFSLMGLGMIMVLLCSCWRVMRGVKPRVKPEGQTIVRAVRFGVQSPFLHPT